MTDLGANLQKAPSWQIGVTTKYYFLGSSRVAQRQGRAGPVTYLYHDHLGSTVASSEQESARYWPYGDSRAGAISTAYQYTGQRHETALGLYYYNARWYDPAIGRFIQADSIVPAPGNPQSLNRYAYAYNNPLRYTDPTGHIGDPDRDYGGHGNYDEYHLSSQPRFIPAIVRYIHGEMKGNAVGTEAAVMRACLKYRGPNKAVLNIIARISWGSMVADWRLNRLLWAAYPQYRDMVLVGQWDHKRVLGNSDLTPDPAIPEEGYSWIGDAQYRSDIWANMAYGYTGAAIGFSETELLSGAGMEQVLSDLASRQRPRHSRDAPTWLAGWDDPYDVASIQLGYALWMEYGTQLYPIDIYRALQKTTGLLRRP